jgi:hypothetical protein
MARCCMRQSMQPNWSQQTLRNLPRKAPTNGSLYWLARQLRVALSAELILAFGSNAVLNAETCERLEASPINMRALS